MDLITDLRIYEKDEPLNNITKFWALSETSMTIPSPPKIDKSMKKIRNKCLTIILGVFKQALLLLG